MDGAGRINVEGSAPSEGTQATARQRDSLFMVAQMRVASEVATIDVRVRNLSSGGLMIELDGALDTGTAVALEMRGLGEVTGVVAWYTRGRAGIALDHEIDPKRVRKPVGGGGSTPDYAKPLLMTHRPRR